MPSAPAISQTTTSQLSTLRGAVEQAVTNANIIASIFEKNTLTNSDVAIVSTVACAGIALVSYSGTATFSLSLISNYPHKEEASKVTKNELSETERQFVLKFGATEALQTLVAKQIMDSAELGATVSPASVEEGLKNLGGVACDLKTKNLGDPNQSATDELVKLSQAMGNAVIGIAVALVDDSITVETDGIALVVGFVSSHWGWERVKDGWNEAKEAWDSFMGRKKG